MIGFIRQVLSLIGTIVKYNIGIKTLLQQSISVPVFYGDLRIVGKPNFRDQFKKMIKRYIIKKSGIPYPYHTIVCMPGCKPNHSL